MGRPKGSLSKKTKHTEKDDIIKEYLHKKIPKSSIAKILDVDRKTLSAYIKRRNII